MAGNHTVPTTAPLAAPLAAGLVGVAALAFALRILLVGWQSVYMDESTFILTGRTLIEARTMYARALDWTYGSYLWPLLAGAADRVGGIALVRTLTASFGTIMALATALTAARLLPPAVGPRRLTAALIAGLLMATFPTAIGVGRFGTYDAAAGAAFMGGCALLAAARRRARPGPLLLPAAGLLFLAFLAKYVVAIYFPPICLYLLLAPLARSPRDFRALARNLASFVLPLSAACAAYFLAFRAEMLTLLAFSPSDLRHTLQRPDWHLKSDTPWREYVSELPELWVLAAVAALGLWRLPRPERLIAAGGAATIVAFQAITRPDFDWWKHSIYLIFFLAPPAGLALAPLAAAIASGTLAVFGSRPVTGTERVVAITVGAAGVLLGARVLGRPDFAGWRSLAVAVLLLAPLAGLALAPAVAQLLAAVGRPAGRAGWRTIGIALATGALLPLPLALTQAEANRTVTFYPNLNPALAGIAAHTAGARTALIDDSALRYYFYPRIPTEHVTEPFGVNYLGLQGMEGYRRAITDRYYDAIVLDGGIDPPGRRIRGELGELITLHYDRVYVRPVPTASGRREALVEVYRPRKDAGAPLDRPLPEGAFVYRFDAGLQGWGGNPEGGELQPGLRVVIGEDRPWNGRPSLQFTPDERVAMIGVKRTGPVTRVRAQVYVEGAELQARFGLFGLDRDWQWRDDGFRQVVPTGRWVEVTWELAEPGVYHQIGLKLSPGAPKTIYLGQVVLEP